MVSYRSLVEMVTAFLCTMIAGMSLMLPVNYTSSGGSISLQLDRLAYSAPRAIGAGCVIALIVAVFATSVNHGLAAWGAALVGMILLFGNQLFVAFSDPSSWVATVNFVDSLAAGIVLGGIAVAVLHGWLQLFGWTVGALGSIAANIAFPNLYHRQVYQPTAAHAHAHLAALTPLWLPGLTLILVAIGTVTNRNRRDLERRTVELPLAPIMAGMVIIGVTLVATEWLANGPATFLKLTAYVVVAVVAAFFSAILLPHRDGTLVLLAVPLSTAIDAILPSTSAGAWVWIVLIILSVGLMLGIRRPSPMLAMAILAALVTVTAITTASGHLRSRETAASMVLALVSGYAFGSAPPRYNPARVLGVAILVLPTATTLLRQRSHLEYAPAIVNGDQASGFPNPVAPTSASAHWTSLAVTGGCALGLLALRKWREPYRPSQRDEVLTGLTSSV